MRNSLEVAILVHRLNGANLDFSCVLSSYAENLAHEVRCRYLDKLAVIERIDPMRDSVFGEPSDKTHIWLFKQVLLLLRL